MFKSLRVPEQLFELTMWVVTLVFAGFLIGLGNKVVGDLPGVDQHSAIETYIPRVALDSVRARRSTLAETRRALNLQRETSQVRLTAAENASRNAGEAFQAWIATRTATTDPQQDPEVLRRTRDVEQLKRAERDVQAETERLDAALLTAVQSTDSLDLAESALNAAARPPYEREMFRKELMVFIIRLLMTAPLLVIAGWLVARHRKSEYWPLGRGFVLFALFAFFVELVPYLPSYGGYVRYGVGVVATAIAGLYVIRAMRRFVAKRHLAEQQTVAERRRTMGYEEAVKKMNAGVCPGCERAIAGGLQSPSNFCVHCGLNLFDNCPACSTRKNAFFQYCPSCGVQTSARDTSTTASTTAV
jgi:hypothetical protein